MKTVNTVLKNALMTICGFCMLAGTAGCQTDNPSGENAEQKGPWFKVTLYSEGVWIIDDNGNANMYLVEGADSALLIDTGTGTKELKDIVDTITDLPVIVVNTHGHPDHIGGNSSFDKAYLPPADTAIYRYFINEAARNNAEKAGKEPELVMLKKGHVFDLGNRKLEVIAIAGHTPGSIGLLDAENKLLFSGDSNNNLIWMFLDHSLPLEVLLQNLLKLQQRTNDFDFIMPGHGTPLDKTFLDEQITCARNILNGNCEPESYESFMGTKPVCKFKRASIVYNPDNLRSAE